ncbi:hypothetical protein ACFZCF_20705 [Streptomyces sp. NPDC007945]
MADSLTTALAALPDRTRPRPAPEYRLTSYVAPARYRDRRAEEDTV